MPSPNPLHYVNDLEDYVPKGPRGLVESTHPLFVVRDAVDVELAQGPWTRFGNGGDGGVRIEADDRWLAAGAGVGGFAVLAAKLGADAVVPIEVDEARFRVLERNVFLNDVSGDPILGGVVPVGHSSGVGRFLDDDGLEVMAPAYAIDELAERMRATAVRLSLDGSERRVLAGWTPPPRVRKVALEWSFAEDRRLDPLYRVLAALEERFESVSLSRRLPDTALWPFYPPTIFVYAWSSRSGART